MPNVKITCPKCIGTGLLGNATVTVCDECKGVGTITVDNSQTLATLNAASQVPIVVTAPPQPSKAATKIATQGK